MRLLLVCALVLSLAVVSQAYVNSDIYGTWTQACTFAFTKIYDFYTATTFDWTSPDSYTVVVDTYIATPGSCTGAGCCSSANLAIALTITGTYSVNNLTLTYYDTSRKVTIESDTAALLASNEPFKSCLGGTLVSNGQTVDITNSTACAFLQLPICPSGISVYIYVIAQSYYTLQSRSIPCVSNSTLQTTANKQGGGSASGLYSWASFVNSKLEDVMVEAVY